MFYWALQSSINGQGRQKLGERSIAQRAADYPLRNISEVGGRGKAFGLSESAKSITKWWLYARIISRNSWRWSSYGIVIRKLGARVMVTRENTSWGIVGKFGIKTLWNCRIAGTDEIRTFFIVMSMEFIFLYYLENAMQYGRYHSLQAMNWLI